MRVPQPARAGAADEFAAAVAEIDLARPTVPVWSNQMAAPYPDDPAGMARLLVDQIDHPVRCREQVEAMYRVGVGVFVEAGPGRVLTGLVDQILGDRPHQAIPVDVPGGHGLDQLLEALAALAVAGVPLSLDPLVEGREIAALGARQVRPGAWTIDGHLVRGPDGRPVAGGLRPTAEVGALVLDDLVPASKAAALDAKGAVTAQARLAGAVAAAAPAGHAGPTTTPADIFPPDFSLPLLRQGEGDPVIMEYLRGLSRS